jgi:acetyl-CoA acyltransferase
VAAWNEGRLVPETMTVYPEPDSQPVTRDVGPRADQSLESLAKLKPYFDRRWGTVTIGNSCQVTDGAVALLVMDSERAAALGYRPLGRIRAYAYAGCDPSRMGLGPVYSSARALHAAGLRLTDMELIELNEAFAAQVLACLRAFESPPPDCATGNGGAARLLGPIDPEKLNVNGGAIALGHPVGATGTRLVLTLLHELSRRNQRIGLATLCVGGGQGAAVIVEHANV